MGNTLNINEMTSSALGIGTLSAMEKATSPKGILEHLKNIFTLGGVRREKEDQYRAFIQSMSDALSNGYYKEGDDLPERITINPFNGHKIEFAPNSDNYVPRTVKVVVTSPNDMSEFIEIPYENFKKTVETIAFRAKHKVPQYGIVLTDKGGMYLRGARLAGVTLSNLNLRDADLSHSEMSNVTLDKIDLTGANLKNSNIQRINISDSDFSKACLEKVFINEAKIIRSNFVNTNFKGSSLLRGDISDGCIFSDSDMRHSNFSKSNFLSAILERCDFSDSTLMCVTFNQTTLADTLFRNATMDYLDCEEGFLKNTDFRGASLFEARCLDSKPHQAIFDNYIDIPRQSASDGLETSAEYIY